ncbi:uncharacterized, partial [Tachysurus ichikawai]
DNDDESQSEELSSSEGVLDSGGGTNAVAIHRRQQHFSFHRNELHRLHRDVLEHSEPSADLILFTYQVTC